MVGSLCALCSIMCTIRWRRGCPLSARWRVRLGTIPCVRGVIPRRSVAVELPRPKYREWRHLSVLTVEGRRSAQSWLAERAVKACSRWDADDQASKISTHSQREIVRARISFGDDRPTSAHQSMVHRFASTLEAVAMVRAFSGRSPGSEIADCP
jgi:hypothetical protein